MMNREDVVAALTAEPQPGVLPAGETWLTSAAIPREMADDALARVLWAAGYRPSGDPRRVGRWDLHSAPEDAWWRYLWVQGSPQRIADALGIGGDVAAVLCGAWAVDGCTEPAGLAARLREGRTPRAGLSAYHVPGSAERAWYPDVEASARRAVWYDAGTACAP